MSDVVLCGRAATHRRRIMVCWGDCNGRRRRVVVSYPTSPWYSPIATCCACGDSWSDGELLPRPFVRGWRQTAAAKAKDRWRTAGTGPVVRDADGYIAVSRTEA